MFRRVGTKFASRTALLGVRYVGAGSAALMQGKRMEKTTKLRPWTKDDVRKLAREKAKTTVIARKLKRTPAATKQKAVRLGVPLGGGRKKRA
jgi:hypothetical protein